MDKLQEPLSEQHHVLNEHRGTGSVWTDTINVRAQSTFVCFS